MNAMTEADTSPQCCMAARQSGRAVINDILHRLRRRIAALETLSGMLPAVLTPEQDDALWSVALGLERI